MPEPSNIPTRISVHLLQKLYRFIVFSEHRDFHYYDHSQREAVTANKETESGQKPTFQTFTQRDIPWIKPFKSYLAESDLHTVAIEHTDSFLERLHELELFNGGPEDRCELSSALLRRNDLFRIYFDYKDPEMRCIVTNSIRQETLDHYLATWGPELDSTFNAMSTEVSNIVSSEKNLIPFTNIISKLENIASVRNCEHNTHLLFIEVAIRTKFLVLKYIENKGVYCKITNDNIDTEYLTSNLFGSSSRIEGFDQMFGGGGIIWGRRTKDTDIKINCRSRARFVQIGGSPGSGKTTLCSLLAVDIATNNGLAWINQMEQKPEEITHLLSTMGVDSQNRNFDIATTYKQLGEYIKHRKTEPSITSKGLLFIFDTSKSNVDDIFFHLSDIDDDILSSFETILFIVDPLDAVLSGETSRDTPESSRLALLKEARNWQKTGINVLFTTEKSESDPKNIKSISEKVADITIDLSIDTKSPEYNRRMFEITKSRLQRAHRGRHGFSIAPSKGIVITPEAPALAAQLRERKWKGGRFSSFGWKIANKALGPRAFYTNDIITLYGASGFKLQFALLFLLFRDRYTTSFNQNSKSLIISLKHAEGAIRSTIKQYDFKNTDKYIGLNKSSNSDLIVFDDLATPTLHPAFVLGKIQKTLEWYRDKGEKIDRMLIDNIEIWEKRCPFLVDSRFFFPTLIEICQKQDVCLMIVCGNKPDAPGSPLQESAISSSNAILEFKEIELNGDPTHAFRVRKTRSMFHDVDWKKLYRKPITGALTSEDFQRSEIEATSS